MAFQSIASLSPRRCRTTLVGGLLLAILTRGALAVQAQELYQAAVPVSGQGVEERNSAIAQALLQVLVKISGSRSVADRKEARELAGEAAGLVQQYRYDLPPAVADGGQPAGRLLWVSFDPRALQQTLRDRGLPVWGTRRPTLLLWLGVERGGKRRFFQRETDAELAQAVEGVGRERGMAFLLPLMDVEDLNRLQIVDLWGGFESPVRAASERYGADLVLVGRMEETGSASWQLLRGDRVEQWRSSGEDALAEGLQEAVDRVAASYAPAAAPEGVGGILVRVRGIGDFYGFVRVDRFFKSLEEVGSVALERVEPDQALFRLRLHGGIDALARSASVGGVLVAEPLEPALPGVGGESVQLPDLSFRYLE